MDFPYEIVMLFDFAGKVDCVGLKHRLKFTMNPQMHGKFVFR